LLTSNRRKAIAKKAIAEKQGHPPFITLDATFEGLHEQFAIAAIAAA
jgi:hypothetical protein